VPSPAVIPAPRAYINVVAVKGFVVELWGTKPRSSPGPTVRESLDRSSRTSETKFTGALCRRQIREQCPQADVRIHYCD